MNSERTIALLPSNLDQTSLRKLGSDIVNDVLYHITASDLTRVEAVQVEALADEESPDLVSSCPPIDVLWRGIGEDGVLCTSGVALWCLRADELRIFERLGELAASKHVMAQIHHLVPLGFVVVAQHGCRVEILRADFWDVGSSHHATIESQQQWSDSGDEWV